MRFPQAMDGVQATNLSGSLHESGIMKGKGVHKSAQRESKKKSYVAHKMERNSALAKVILF